MSPKWQLSAIQELAFDGLTGTEFLVSVPCAYDSVNGRYLTLADLINHLNQLEATLAPNTLTPHAQQIRALLREAGIDWNKTTARLAKCNWVDAAYIQGHTAAVSPDHIGIAIRRMLAGDPIPPCRCGRCPTCYRRTLDKYPQIKQ